jgi:hypothetical protein
MCEALAYSPLTISGNSYIHSESFDNLIFFPSISIGCQGDHFDLDDGAKGQGRDLKGASRRPIGREILSIHFIEVHKIIHLSEKYRCFHDSRKIAIRRLQDSAQVLHHLARLFSDPSFDELACGWIKANLP